MCAAEDTARAKEKKPFECRVVDGVQECRREREGREGAANVLPSPQSHRQTHPDEDDPNVFDAVECEQALEVVLLERVEHTEHGGGRTQDQYRPSPRGRERPVDRSKKVEGEAEYSVD